MTKLIVSDIDGTLLPYGETVLSPRLFGQIRRLRERGILFCPASGRQYHSLRLLFAPVADEICYVCENGAVLFGAGPEEGAPLLAKTVLPRDDALALSHAIMDLPACYVLISGENTSYVCRCPEKLVEGMRASLGNRMVRVERPEDIREEIVKVSLFCTEGLEAPAAALGPRWGDAYHMAVAGRAWLDFTLSDKGKGLRALCAALGVDLADTMAFGDNWNDVPMLDLAGAAYLMEGADPVLRERYPRRCANVMDALEALLAEDR